MSERSHAADVVIVGAGISGWMLATLLAGSGLSVAVLGQRYQRSRDGSFSGVVTQPDLNALGRGRGSLDRLIPLQSASAFHLQGTLAPVQQGVSGAFALPHEALLTGLRSRVVAQGVHFDPDGTVTDFSWRGGAIGGVVLRHGEMTWDARVTVLADESDPRLAEAPGLRPESPPTQLMHIAKQRFEHSGDMVADSALTQAVSLFSGLTSWGQEGFGIVIPGDRCETLAVAMLLEDEMTSTRHIGEFLDEVRTHPVIAFTLQGCEASAFVTEVIPIGGVIAPPRLTGDGVMALGDIAGLTHPLNRDGVSTNLDIAMLAAETILEAAKVQDFSSIALSRFDDRVRERVIGGLRREARAEALAEDRAWIVSTRFAPLAGLAQMHHAHAHGESGEIQNRQPPVSLRHRLKGLGQRIRQSD